MWEGKWERGCIHVYVHAWENHIMRLKKVLKKSPATCKAHTPHYTHTHHHTHTHHTHTITHTHTQRTHTHTHTHIHTYPPTPTPTPPHLQELKPQLCVREHLHPPQEADHPQAGGQLDAPPQLLQELGQHQGHGALHVPGYGLGEEE